MSSSPTDRPDRLRAPQPLIRSRPIALSIAVLALSVVVSVGYLASLDRLPPTAAGGDTPAPSSPRTSPVAATDFRFLPALPGPAPTPAPSSGLSAAPVGILGVTLATGTMAATDGAPAWVTWAPSGGSRVTGIQGAVDGGALRPVVSNPRSGRTQVAARSGHDYGFVLAGTTSSGGPAASVGLGFRLTAVDDVDSRIAYGGTWAAAAYAGYLGRSARYSHSAGSSISFSFTGRSVAWVGPVGPGRGQARVLVDGRAVRTVSEAAAQFAPRHVLFATSWPVVGDHTIQIEVDRGGGNVALDSFAVLADAPAPAIGTPAPGPGSSGPPTPLPNAVPPIRAAFYYGWYPEGWAQQGVTASTTFHPTAGAYDSSDPAILASQIRAMRYGGITAGLASWWGPDTRTDGRMPELLAAARGTGLSWAVNIGLEETGDPDVGQIAAYLQYIKTHYASDPAYLRIGGRFVVFVTADAADDCGMATRWTRANTLHAYLVLPTLAGAAGCQSQPDDWYRSDPASGTGQVGQSSYTISPGFWHQGAAQTLARDLDRWARSVAAMVASGARFQLVDSFNEWSDGTSVESADEWATASTFGSYLDVLHRNGLAASADGSPDGVLVGAGNIASCRSTNDDATAKLVASVAGTVFTLGDASGDRGAPADYRSCYGPTWGAFLDRTRPAIGSGDYGTPGAAGYFGYFGSVAGDPPAGWYAYNLGSWRIYVLNSSCTLIGGCGKGSPEEQWLLADLTANPHACVGAYWQKARFSSGRFGDDRSFQAFWTDLYDHGAEFVINGHDRNYQRYAPQTPTGKADPAAGIREFVVGTGGNGHTPVQPDPVPNREAANDTAYGVLRLTLQPGGYEWQFLSTPKTAYTDSGSDSCH